MPALMPTKSTAKVTYLGYVNDREAALASDGVDTLQLTFGGFEAEAHGGLTRKSCSRVRDLYPRGTEIRNTRQLSIVSEEELRQIAATMGVEKLEPQWLGASMVVSGLPNFTHIPPSTRLQAPSGATLTVDMENRPCHLPAPVIDTHFPGQGKLFKSAAKGLRGVTAWVEREGPLYNGDILKVFIPDQPDWLGKKDL